MKITLPLKYVIVPVLACFAVFMAVADSITDLPLKIINNKSYYAYDVKPKETVFSITHKFNITSEQLLQYNPSVRDGLKAYSTLYFPADVFGTAEPYARSASEPETLKPEEPENQTDLPAPAGYKRVVIQRGQSLFGIAREYNITIDELLAANPDINSSSYRAGQSILVPLSGGHHNISTTPAPVREVIDTPPAPVAPDVEEEPLAIVEEESDTAAVDTLLITIMLPFETTAANPSRQAALATEFYRGFLLGVEQLSGDGQPLRLQVVDTWGDPFNFATVLNSERIASTDLFIGPFDERQLALMASRADDTGAVVINPFVMKEEAYISSPSVVQLNIPRDEMYAGAIEEFVKIAGSREVVFLARVDGEADKVPFADKLKEALDSHGIVHKDIVFRGVLTTDDLTRLSPGSDYVFIPVSSSRAEFGKIAGGLREFKNMGAEQGGSMQLLGYPDWTTFRGDQLDMLREFNTTIYSRFVNDNNPTVRRLKADYHRWFGEDWSDVEPNQALMGYDVAQFAINNLRRGEGEFFPSATEPFAGQHFTFMLEKPLEGSGYVNSALYIITFNPAGDVRSRAVKVNVTPLLAQ